MRYGCFTLKLQIVKENVYAYYKSLWNVDANKHPQPTSYVHFMQFSQVLLHYSSRNKKKRQKKRNTQHYQLGMQRKMSLSEFEEEEVL